MIAYKKALINNLMSPIVYQMSPFAPRKTKTIRSFYMKFSFLYKTLHCTGRLATVHKNRSVKAEMAF